LNDISIFLSVLAKATTFKASLVPWPGENRSSPEDDLTINTGPESCLEYMYGITPTIAAAIQGTCRLAEYVSWYEADTASIPESLLEACEALGDRLLSWSLDLEEVTTIPSNDAEMKSIFDHHAKAWHSAAVIYYCRRIQNCLIKGLAATENLHGQCELKTGVTDKMSSLTPQNLCILASLLLSVDGLQEPKAQVARAAHTLSVCKRHLTHELLPLLLSTLHHHN
jgi:hypothetical protein